MRVLILSQYYPPESVPIPDQVARSLQAKGHQVHVLTGFPNYPSGRVHDGYSQRWRTREVVNGIPVTRIPLFADHSSNVVRRSLNYLTFALSSATARQLISGADIVYVYATQLTAAVGPWFWRPIGGAPYVLHVQDLWPDSIVGSSLVRSGVAGELIESVISRWAKSVYRRASATIGIGPSMASLLQQRGARSDCTHVVFNWADEQTARVRSRRSRREDGRGVEIVFAGNIGDMQDLENAVEAAHRARDAGVHLTIIGHGVARDRVRTAAAALGAQNVTFREPVPSSQMPEEYAKANFSLVSLKNLDVFRATVPSKLQASLRNGVPVIASVGGDVSRIVEDYEVGVVAEPSDVASLTAAFRTAASLSLAERERLAQRAEEVYEALFSLRSGMDQIESILQGSLADAEAES